MEALLNSAVDKLGRSKRGGGGGRDVFIKMQPCCILTSNFGEGVSGEENSHCSPY